MSAHANSFHLLRLVAATLVIVSHGYVLTGQAGDPVWPWLGATAGFIGVAMFFAMSGWLVTASFASDPHLGRFFARRALRIYPALAVTVLAMAFVLGPAVTTLRPGAYFAHAETYDYLKGLLVFPIQHVLPGVFEDVPYKRSVNGSLWTLGPEVFCYALVAAVGALALLRRRVIALLLASALVVIYVLSPQGPTTLAPLAMQIRLVGELVAFFLSGSLLWMLRAWIPFHAMALPIFLLAMWAGAKADVASAVMFALLPYAILGAALADSGTSRIFARLGDWSYGTYLWAFPIQQLLVHTFASLTVWEHIAVAVALSWTAGAISWHVIEKRALAYKPSTRVAQPGRQPVDRQVDAAPHALVPVAGAMPAQQLELQVVERVQVREAVADRPGQRWI